MVSPKPLALWSGASVADDCSTLRRLAVRRPSAGGHGACTRVHARASHPSSERQASRWPPLLGHHDGMTMAPPSPGFHTAKPARRDGAIDTADRSLPKRLVRQTMYPPSHPSSDRRLSRPLSTQAPPLLAEMLAAGGGR